ILDRRGAARTSAGFLVWSFAAGLVVAGAMLGLVGLARLVEAPAPLVQALLGFLWLALVAVFFVSWWWRRPRRLHPGGRWPRFALEHLIGGGVLAGGLFFVPDCFAPG